ncbi:type II secretion system protein GspL [Pararhodobacter sp.]|uniref:type II secretion system protein GspL n=1 Tax=Pararhodobacter sp. TaxID=2127056 RepID=UPI002FE12748
MRDSASARRRAPAPATWRIGDGAPPAGPFVALVPGAEAPLIALTLPAALKGVAREDVARRQALDRMGPGLDVRPARLEGAEDWARVAVAERTQVLRWRGALGPAAARCRGLVPDYLALPAAPALWVVEADRDGVVARLGPADGFAAEHALALRMLALALAEARAGGALPRAVLLTGETAPAFAPLFEGMSLVSRAGDLPAALTPRVMALGEAAVDFARDPRADAEGVEARIRRLIWPALLVVLGALGWAGAQGLGIARDRAEAAAVQAETLAAVRRDLLPSGPILDLEVQVMREIERRRSAARPEVATLGPLDLLRQAAPVLAGTEVQAVTLGADGLSVEVQVPDFQALDALVEALAAADLAVRASRSAIDPAGGVGATLALEALP